MASTWGMNPMSSMRSASSRMSTSIFDMSTSFWRIKSSRRPGVATTKSATAAFLAWRSSGTPP